MLELGRHQGYIQVVACALCLSASMPAQAMDFSFGDVSGSLKIAMSVGVAMRMGERDPALVGKLNLPGQFSFCEDKMGGVNCSGVPGNARYLALPGRAGVNSDNGDLNYDQGELVAGVFRMVPELHLQYLGFEVNLSAFAFYDVVNDGREDRHPNNFSNHGFQPARTARADIVNEAIGADIRLLNAYISHDFAIGDLIVQIRLGRQRLSWGEALTLILNGISTINPPDPTILTMPGSKSGDFLIPEPMLDLSAALTETLSIEVFYQYGWQGARLPPDGGYFSTSDVLSDGGRYAMALFGKYREDPNSRVGAEGRLQGNLALLSRSGRTVYRVADNEPEEGGQYGVRLGYFAYWLNNTSFGLYFHNLHSRLPFASFIAAQKGCLSDATNAVDVLVACQGFANVPLIGKEPAPFDTIQLFRDYPEDIRTFGASFSTNLGPVAWAGEIAYRPNQPLQINPVDLAFAAAQPLLPAHTISLAVVDIPGKRVAAPDYVETRYRHHSVRPGQIIRGYERFKTIQYATSFIFVRGRSANYIGADSVTTVVELGAYEVLNMPALDALQLASTGTDFHHSAGVDGSGTPNAEQAGSDRGIRLNPTYQASGFATRWSYGYRILGKADYQNLIPGIQVSPQLAFFHDVGGTAPLPTGQFVEGRKQLKLGVNLRFDNQISTTLRYTWIWGGGAANLLSDRDYIQWSLGYVF